MELTFVLPHWMYWGGLALIPVAIHLAVRRTAQARAEAEAMARDHHPTSEEIEEALSADARLREDLGRESGFVRAVDKVSTVTGGFVAYWAPIAVFVYFYEVVARYFFDSPTNWAHESMFLMFGMMYILSGAYGYLHGAHVRVDLFYARFSGRVKAAVDIMTFPFFAIFALALMWTGWTFFTQVMDQNRWFFATGFFDEVSFTEWAIQYWPVKMTIFFGAILLLLAGVSHLVKDIKMFRYSGASSIGRIGQ